MHRRRTVPRRASSLVSLATLSERGRAARSGQPRGKGVRLVKAFREAMRELATSDATLRAIGEILSDPSHVNYAGVLALVAKHGSVVFKLSER